MSKLLDFTSVYSGSCRLVFLLLLNELLSYMDLKCDLYVLKKFSRLGIVAHTCNPHTWEFRYFKASVGYTVRHRNHFYNFLAFNAVKVVG